MAWLDQHGIPYRDLCFLGDKPEVEADAYVDDAPHNVEALRAAGNDVIVFDQPYNGHVDGPGPARGRRSRASLPGPSSSKARGGVVEQTLPGFDEGAARLHRRRQGRLKPTPDRSTYGNRPDPVKRGARVVNGSYRGGPPPTWKRVPSRVRTPQTAGSCQPSS